MASVSWAFLLTAGRQLHVASFHAAASHAQAQHSCHVSCMGQASNDKCRNWQLLMIRAPVHHILALTHISFSSSPAGRRDEHILYFICKPGQLPSWHMFGSAFDSDEAAIESRRSHVWLQFQIEDDGAMFAGTPGRERLNEAVGTPRSTRSDDNDDGASPAVAVRLYLTWKVHFCSVPQAVRLQPVHCVAVLCWMGAAARSCLIAMDADPQRAVSPSLISNSRMLTCCLTATQFATSPFAVQ